MEVASNEWFTGLVDLVKSAPSYKPTSTDRISEDGKSIICTVCGQVKRELRDSELFEDWWVPVNGGCDCERAKAEAEKQKNIRESFMNFWNGKKYLDLLGKRYEHVTFDDLKEIDNKSWQTARKACKDYVDSIEICLAKGYGMYLCSPQAGNGKTTLLACVRNALIEKQVRCVFINYTDLVSLASDRGNENASTVLSFNGLMSVDVLLIDDIGAEDLRKNANRGSWINGFLYELLDNRYKDCLCTLFSSNYSIRQLQDLRGYDFKACDRINGASSKAYMITGDSIRGEAWEIGR